MKTGKLVLLLLAMIGVLGVLAACGDDATPTPTARTAVGVTPTATPTFTPIPTATPTPEGERPEYGGWLYTGRGGRAAVDPYSSLVGTSYLWAEQEALLGYAQPYDPSVGPVVIPKLATDWSVDDTGALWTFTLRQGVKWHDGEDFNADDVVATFNRAIEPNFAIARRSLVIKAMVVSITKVDDYTVVIDTGEANASFISIIANNHSAIAPEHLITGDPTSDDPNEKWVIISKDTTGTLAVGTGPYRMIDWDPEACVTFERFEDYWAVDQFGNQLPYLDGWKDCDPLDDSREFAKFVTREFQTSDFTGLGLDEAQSLCDKTVDPETCRTAQHGHGWFSIILNHNIAPLDDPRVVKAARYSLDARDAMEFQFGEGTGEGAYTWIDRDSFAASTLTAGEMQVLMPWTDDSRREEMDQAARDLLTEAGFPDGLDLPQPWISGCSRLFRNFYTPMIDSFVKNGLRGSQECREGIISTEEQQAGRFAVVIYAAGITFMDPLNSFNLSGTSWAGAVGRGPWAWDGVETVDELYYKALATVDEDERNDVLKDLERFLGDDTLTQFPVGHNKMTVPINGCLKNYYPGPGMYHGMQHRTSWLTEECQLDAP
jgi:ABC-type transport system substrate-binding protein